MIDHILSFWFGTLDEHGFSADDVAKRWFTTSAEFDQEIRDKFASEYEAIVAGQRTDWLATVRGRLATVIVLDQLSRNMFRDSPKMYAADDLALRIVLDAMAEGSDRQLPAGHRVFFYMPLMHSEDIALQDQCVAAFTQLLKDTDGHERVAANVTYAERHRDIVKQWGRFPHRNKILDRNSTPEEVEFLKQPGSSF